MIRAIIPFIILCFLACTSKTSYRLPAEWEPHQAMMVSFNDDDLAADSVSVEIVKALSPSMKVYCVIMHDTMTSYYLNWFQKEQIPLDSIQFMPFGSSFSYSIRDPLFFLQSNKGTLAITDFAWNDYGYLPTDSAKRKAFLESSAHDRNGYEANFLQLFPYPLIPSKMVNEGGAIEVNGKGTILQVETVNRQRNPHMSFAEQEAELKRVLGVQKVIWLKEGMADDPDAKSIITQNYFGIGVNGHIDEFCRFTNANTILLAYPDSLEAAQNPVFKISYDRMRVNEKILATSVDQDGQPFKIIRTPVPDLQPLVYILDSTSADAETKRFSKTVFKKYPQFKTGDTTYFLPASSYLNYLVTNQVVLIPKYWKPGLPESTKQKDEAFKTIIAAAFPGRSIIQINPYGLNLNGGGIHCWTQQVPK